MKKTAPKKTIASTNSPARDEKALIFPISAIKLGKNVRDKLEHIEELAASIKENGLLQALVIAKVPGGFELVAGQRRLAALKLLGERSAPVRLVGADPNQIVLLRLVENLQRDELTGWETCKAIHALLPQFSTQKKLSAAVGKTESYVSKCIAVVKATTPEKVECIQDRSLFELFAMLSQNGQTRKPSGAIAGGRSVAGAIQFRDRGNAFSLRLNFNADRTPPDTKAKIIETLREVIQRLEQPQQKPLSGEVAIGG